MNCDEALPLLHALIDGELDAVHAREVERHAAGCARCTAELAALRAMRGALSDTQLRFTAPAALRQRIEAALPVQRVSAPATSRRSLLKGFVFGTALSTAIAATALVVVVRDSEERHIGSELVSAHLRSLQGDRLTDVLSSDQHTVKPWFNGKLDVAPPVEDLTPQGFPLVGGRLDYLDGKPVAVIVYRHQKHLINLFVAPRVDTDRSIGSAEKVQGFNLRRWTAAGLSFAAVSDVNADELRDFMERFEAATRGNGG